MAKRFKKLTALPSKIIIGDNPPVLLSSLSEEELEECRERMTARLAAEVSRQFELHPECWKAVHDYHPIYMAEKAAREAERAKNASDNG